MMNRILFSLLAGLAMTSCRTTPKDLIADPADKEASSSIREIRPQDVAAVNAFKKKGGKGGFHADKLKEKLTPQNSRFVVDLDAQRLYVFQGDELVAYSPVSTGRKYYRTETGDYTIGEKDLNHRSSSYGSFVTSRGGTLMSDVQQGFDPTPAGARFQGALMKYFQRLHYKGSPTAMGFHTGVLPGYPASHGCIRLPATMAAWFWENTTVGIPVLVRGKANGVPIGANQNRPKRSPKVHSSLKKKTEPKPAVPSAPESDVKTTAPAPESTPDPAPTPEPAAPAESPAPKAEASAPAPSAPEPAPPAGGN